MSRFIDQPACKGTLAHWVSLSLQKALQLGNIRSRFRANGIYPLNRIALDANIDHLAVYANMAPAAVYARGEQRLGSETMGAGDNTGASQEHNGDHISQHACDRNDSNTAHHESHEVQAEE